MVDRLNRTLITSAVLLGFAMAGCSEHSQRLNAPPQGVTDRPNELQKPFATMSDNAARKDASIVDMHFEPHVAELSGLGVWRLTRMGEAMMATGGVIHYQTNVRDESLIAARLQSARDFLAASGFDTDRITVKAGMSPNAGGYAAEAIEARNAALEGEGSAAAPAAGGSMMGPQ